MSVSTAFQQRIKALVKLALELDDTERAAFLDRACSGDLSLRREVESQLTAPGAATGDVGPAPEQSAAAASVESSSILGKSIAHYKILSFLGHGGMGEVYLAQDAKLGRKVTIKLLPNALGNAEERLRRFEPD